MYKKWSVPQLKKELRKRGGLLVGKKADLVDRLEVFDRNSNFGLPQIDAEPQKAKLQLPDPDTYHDINSTTVLPSLTKEHIHLYYHGSNKKPDEGLELYGSKYFAAIRSTNILQDHTFIKAITKAPKKWQPYEINIKLHQSGNIEEAMCECASGSGSGIFAQCIHVGIALFAVEQIVRDRDKNLHEHPIPTNKIQKCHLSKTVNTTSTPNKSLNLPLKRKIENGVFSPYKEELNKEAYNEKFRKNLLNYSKSIKLRQILMPALPVAAGADHNYCGRSRGYLNGK